jgi:hypothetical protein
MSTAMIVILGFALIGLIVFVVDYYQYKDYDMWEDETGFHMKKRDKNDE